MKPKIPGWLNASQEFVDKYNAAKTQADLESLVWTRRERLDEHQCNLDWMERGWWTAPPRYIWHIAFTLENLLASLDEVKYAVCEARSHNM